MTIEEYLKKEGLSANSLALKKMSLLNDCLQEMN